MKLRLQEFAASDQRVSDLVESISKTPESSIASVLDDERTNMPYDKPVNVFDTILDFYRQFFYQ